MDIAKILSDFKADPDLAAHSGMILMHNGIVRQWSRNDRASVARIEVHSDQARIRAITDEYRKKDGIYKIDVHAASGSLTPGDDLLVIIVAGDVRENVLPVLSDLLNRIKAEAISKREILD
jgi:molybdopterin synthase catalytic subunit